MPEAYALQEGAFGRAVVLDLPDDLVSHAHAETQFAFWLGGGRAVAHLANEEVYYSEDVALGTNSYEMHDARLIDKDKPAVFLVLYIAKPWLDELRASSLSGILCVRHSMTSRSVYAEQEDDEGGCGRSGGDAVDSQGTD